MRFGFAGWCAHDDGFAADKAARQVTLTAKPCPHIENNEDCEYSAAAPPGHGSWCEAGDFRLLVGHRRHNSVARRAEYSLSPRDLQWNGRVA